MLSHLTQALTDFCSSFLEGFTNFFAPFFYGLACVFPHLLETLADILCTFFEGIVSPAWEHQRKGHHHRDHHSSHISLPEKRVNPFAFNCLLPVLRFFLEQERACYQWGWLPMR
jgi:uncharacterized protein involved in cysteine biosynthesis